MQSTVFLGLRQKWRRGQQRRQIIISLARLKYGMATTNTSLPSEQSAGVLYEQGYIASCSPYLQEQTAVQRRFTKLSPPLECRAGGCYQRLLHTGNKSAVPVI